MSESNIENEEGYFSAPPPRWLESLAVVAGVIALLAISGMAMLGTAFLLVLNGYGA